MTTMQGQGRQDGTVSRAGTFADGKDRDVYIYGWLSFLFGSGSLVAAISAVHSAFDTPDFEVKTAAVLAVVAVFTLMASAVLALCGVLRATELRIRRDH